MKVCQPVTLLFIEVLLGMPYTVLAPLLSQSLLPFGQYTWFFYILPVRKKFSVFNHRVSDNHCQNLKCSQKKPQVCFNTLSESSMPEKNTKIQPSLVDHYQSTIYQCTSCLAILRFIKLRRFVFVLQGDNDVSGKLVLSLNKSS